LVSCFFDYVAILLSVFFRQETKFFRLIPRSLWETSTTFDRNIKTEMFAARSSPGRSAYAPILSWRALGSLLAVLKRKKVCTTFDNFAVLV
jgi:hypothetical protein